MNRDLTVGDPKKIIVKFCLPLFGSMIFQQLYNIADSIVSAPGYFNIVLHTEKTWMKPLCGKTLRVHLDIADHGLQLALAG